MNSSIYTEHTNAESLNQWRPVDFLNLIGIMMTLLLNMHQSVKQKHFHSDCINGITYSSNSNMPQTDINTKQEP
jgi:hypothetical protein